MHNVTVINIYGSPGAGKSTEASKIFSKLKEAGKSVELVTEYVKKWAWQDILPNVYDQLYITGKQSKAEQMLFNKVDYIVTDCPLIMGQFYEQYYTDTSIVYEAVDKFIELAEANGVVYKHYLLNRTKPYDTRGRFCSEEGSDKVALALENYLKKKIGDKVHKIDTNKATDFIFNNLFGLEDK